MVTFKSKNKILSVDVSSPRLHQSFIQESTSIRLHIGYRYSVRYTCASIF
uniref:Uncharacterized protein n=1 Tax=Arundo donax TaxID=35708 RepID=A0A0A9A3W1_ARUDO